MDATKSARAKAPQKFSLLWWMAWVTLGLALGFIVPSVLSFTAVVDGRDGTGQFIYTVLGGAAQGLILGFAQGFALRKTAAALPMFRWIAVTALGGLIAWVIGMAPGTFLKLAATTPPAIVILVALAIAAVVVMPSLQFIVLRRTKLGKIGRVGRWVPITAIAWTAGIAWLLLASTQVQDSEDLIHLVGLYTVAGLLMALTVALVTGLGMRWMLNASPRKTRAPRAAGAARASKARTTRSAKAPKTPARRSS